MSTVVTDRLALAATLADPPAQQRHPESVRGLTSVPGGVGRPAPSPALAVLVAAGAAVVTSLAVSAPQRGVLALLAVWLLMAPAAVGRTLVTARYREMVTAVGLMVAVALAVSAVPAPAAGGSLLVVASAATAGAGVVVFVQLAGERSRQRRVVLLGDAASVRRTAQAWEGQPGLEVVGRVALAQPTARPADRPERGGDPAVVAAVTHLVADRGADTVALLPGPAVDRDTVERLCWSLERGPARLVVSTGLDAACGGRLHLAGLAGLSVAAIDPPRPSAAVAAAKALADRIGAALLLLLCAPLLLVLMLLVRLDSRGPAVFTQTRVGRDGRLFTMLKLRTMTRDAEARRQQLTELDEGNGVLFKIKDDPRVTRVGRVLRRTSLDELPQLWNVLRGEMSLVGPRPALPEEVATYDDRARRRLCVRPGLTGLWQVSGRSSLGWEESVDLDVRYTDNITLGRDLAICAATFGAVVARRGAY